MDLSPEMLMDKLIRFPVVIFSLVIHEFMHAYVAYRCGDDTAHRAGRITLNPLVHLDFLGTICLLFAPIGWAKPVPVNPYNYGNPRRDEILVSGAGVAANFVLAAATALALRILLTADMLPQGHLGWIVFRLLMYAIILNFGLFIFNLLPIFPLDGSHILRELLPGHLAHRFADISRYGPLVLIGFVLVQNRIHFAFMGYSAVTPLEAPIVVLMSIFAGPGITGFYFG